MIPLVVETSVITMISYAIDICIDLLAKLLELEGFNGLRPTFDARPDRFQEPQLSDAFIAKNAVFNRVSDFFPCVPRPKLDDARKKLGFLFQVFLFFSKCFQTRCNASRCKEKSLEIPQIPETKKKSRCLLQLLDLRQRGFLSIHRALNGDSPPM